MSDSRGESSSSTVDYGDRDAGHLNSVGAVAAITAV